MGWNQHKSRSRWAAFLGDEGGSASIELMWWIPWFMALLIFAVDATVLYMTQTQMWNVSRDIARRVAIGDITADEATALALQELYMPGANYSVMVESGLDVHVRIWVGIPDASVFGVFDRLIDSVLLAEVTMRHEPV